MKTFEELGLAEPLLQAIKDLGFEAPMPVQEQVIPHLLNEDRDLVALAQTGTGKTAAYGLPLLQRTDPESMQTQSIVLSPTRELCLQIASDLQSFGKYIDGLRILAVYGGASMETQIKALKRGVQIIVATPGRLIDLTHRGKTSLGNVSTVILDEADEMLSMGFSDSIDEILQSVPPTRKTLLFSATMSKEIEKIAKNYLHDAQEIVVGSRNEGAENVNHHYYMVKAKDKYRALKRIVDYYPNIYAIIFCRTRIETQEVADHLIRDGYNAEALHGDLSQAQRDITMKKFREHHTQFLVATDVAARGLDVTDLTHVINYGLPDDVENYTHRSGRTGRAGKSGTSISIVHVKEKGKIRAIEKTIGKKFERCTLPTPEEICTKQLYNVIDQLEHTEVNEEQVAPFMPQIFSKLEWLSKEDLLKRMVQRAFGRFADYYSKEKPIEDPSDKPERATSQERKNRRSDRDKASARAEEGYARLYMNRGRRDHVLAGELMTIVNRYVRDKIKIGRIDLLPQRSFFEVPEEDAQYVIDAFADAVDRRGHRIVVDRADTAPADSGGRRRGFRSSSSAPRNRAERRSAARDDFGGRGRRGDRGSRRFADEPRRGRRRDDFSRPQRQGDAWYAEFERRGSRKKADNRPFVDSEPDFSEDGWQK